MNKDSAKKAAAKLISYKMYTCDEIYKKLIQKGCDKNIAEETVAEFEKYGILNDLEYAKMYIHDGLIVGFKGMFRLKQELNLKGVSSVIIEKAAEMVDIDAEAILERYVELKFGDAVFSDWKDIEKAKAHLSRRGFSIQEINRCFKSLNICVRSEVD